MKKLAYLPVALIVVGCLLLVGAAAWRHVKNPRYYWGEDEANALTTAGLEYHAAAHQMAHAHTQAEEQKFEEARARFHKKDAAFQEATERYERPIRLLRYSGIACLVVGALGYYVLRAVAGG
ncbi:MAG: hypothetical protein JW888_08765 [Pirellulales bacterium]|nr:hypothetical protein [Pirellulales bacterium]